MPIYYFYINIQMKLKFCGAAGTVTGSSHLIELNSGFKILLDCGMYQGSFEDYKNFNTTWLFNPSEVDCLILSHAHIDHCGRIPRFVRDGFTGNIYSTSATRDLASIMLLDSAHIQESDAERSNERRKKRGESLVEPLYTQQDAVDCMQNFVGLHYNKWFKIAPDIEIIFKDAGHILGSANITIRIFENNKYTTIGFSGDIGRPNRAILKDPEQMPQMNYLITESTYGGQIHDSKSDEENKFLKIVYKTCIQNRGKLLIPAFSVGRTQELVYMLNKLYNEKKLPPIKVFVDSPLAVNATSIFEMHQECFDKEMMQLMREDEEPFHFNGLTYVRKVEDSKRLNDYKEPCIIISASGMLQAGRIKHHVANNIANPKNTLLFVGFCSPDTYGAYLKNRPKTVTMFGKEIPVKAKIEELDSLSAHADEPEMMQFYSNLNSAEVKKVFLVHGERERQELMSKTLQQKGFKEIVLPNLGQSFELL